MARIEKQATINAPAEKVFSYLADFPRHSEWAQHELKIEQTSGEPVGQGTTFKSVGHAFGRDNEDKLTITEFVPNERIVFDCEASAGRLRHSFELQPPDGGVQLTKSFEALETRMPFTLLLPVLRAFVLPGALAADLRRIKEKVEGS